MSRLAPVQLRSAHPEPPAAPVARHRFAGIGAWLPVALLTLLGLGLRLMVWRWRMAYPLGGDEREYFEQALTFLQGKGYQELPLMRPPLYTVFLAVVFQLFDSQVQRVRLVQELISAGTIPLVWLWARALLGAANRRAALVTTALAAFCYTFAANASELLTETTFLFGLTLVLWLLVRSTASDIAPRRRLLMLGLAGLAIGTLCLLRSVALPLVPLGAVCLLVENKEQRTAAENKEQRTKNIGRMIRTRLLCSMLYVLCSFLVILPWTARNYLTYGTPIIIDTTGAENLWLDNDPRGREAVKRELYAVGDDRGGRQQLSMQRGIEVIVADPGRFAAKAWGEAQRFVALEYFDDLRARRAIWVPPLEVWLRLVLGDGLWLVVLGGGVAGLWLGPSGRARWLVVPWALYVVVTGLVFHVELRYRLPLYPVLLPYAGWALTRLGALRRVRERWPAALGASLTLLAALTLIGLHRAYLPESWMLARKHYALFHAHRANAAGDRETAYGFAQAAIGLDPTSALARVELGLASGPPDAADWWTQAVAALPAHPYAHLLLGDQLRAAGEDDRARAELAFETSSLEDLQRWAIDRFPQAPVDGVEVGAGLDLGMIQGFYPAVDGARWTTGRAQVVQLRGASALTLRLRSPRQAGAPPATVQIRAGDTLLGTLEVGPDWQAYTLALPAPLRDPATVFTLRLDVAPFRPRAYDPASGDNRPLGVEVDWIKVGQ